MESKRSVSTSLCCSDSQLPAKEISSGNFEAFHSYLVVGDMIFRIQGECDVPGGSDGGGQSCNEDSLLLIS